MEVRISSSPTLVMDVSYKRYLVVLDFNFYFFDLVAPGKSLMSTIFNRDKGVSITYIAGTINKTEKQMFERLIYRASRGRVLVHFDEENFTIKDFEGQEKDRIVYILVFQQV